MGVGGRRTIGIVLIALGVVGGIALWFAAATRYDDAVAGLAPAPIGCDTTLVFDETGTYTFFVESSGSVEAIEGDCASDARTFDARRVPRVTLTLVDADGGNVDLDRVAGPSYDRDGSSGSGIRTADIDVPGTYVLTATATGATDAIVRVGRDPARGVAALRAAAVLTMVAGALAGTIVLALAARAPRPAVVGRTPIPEQPTGLPTRPPLGPPSANPTIPPPYAPVQTYRPPPPAHPPGTPGTVPSGPRSPWPPPPAPGAPRD